MMSGDADNRVEKPGAASDGSGRSPREEEACASNITAAGVIPPPTRCVKILDQ